MKQDMGSSSPHYVAVGLDIGSSYARMAMCNGNGTMEVIANSLGSRSTVALACTRDDEILLGEAAQKALVSQRKQHTCSSIRYFLTSGTNEEPPAEEELNEEKKCNQEQQIQPLLTSFFHHLSTILCEASSSPPYQLQFVLTVPISQTFTPAQVRHYASHVQRSIATLNKLKKKQPNNSNHYSNNPHSKTNKNVLAVITEPMAVCMAHGLLLSTSSAPSSSPPPPPLWNTCVVLDWGASGLTITKLQRISSHTDMAAVTSHTYDTTLSGDRIMDSLIQHLIQQFERKHRFLSVTTTLPNKAYARLHMACTQALKTLVRTSTTHITIDSFYEGIDLIVPLSRPRLDMIVAPFVQKMERLIMAELFQTTTTTATDTKINVPDTTDKQTILDIILLSGGVCEMPSVKERIHKLFPHAWKGNTSYPTDEVVAIGCAAYAQDILQNLASKINDHVTTETCQLYADHPIFPLLTLQQSVVLSPYGIGFIWVHPCDQPATVNPRLVHPLIPVGTPLPTLISKIVPCHADSNDTMPKDSLPSAMGIVAFQVEAQDAQLLAKIPIHCHNDKEKKEMLGLVLELTEHGKLSLWINGHDPIILFE